MIRFVLARFLQSLVALAIVSVVVFILARATGDPLHLILPMSATQEDYAEARRYLGLDRPYVEQYLSFVGKAVRGDFGTSLRARVRSWPSRCGCTSSRSFRRTRGPLHRR